MTVIAMTREMGTLGKDVAAELATALGLEVVHRELVEKRLAERLSLGESAVHRFLEGQPQLWERWKIDPKRLSHDTAEEILRLAMKGNVLIRGWGAAQLLRDVSHVVCVRVCAPMPMRVAEIMRRLDIQDAELAAREIQLNDEAHSRSIQRQRGIDWRDPEHYDLVLNTGFVPVSTCVALISELAKDPAYQPSENSKTVLMDKLIQAEAQTVLDEMITDHPLGIGLDVKVERGAVDISGLTGEMGTLDAAMQRLRTMDGVSEVRSSVVRVPQRYGP